MKKVLSLVMISGLVAFSSCSGGDEKKDEKSDDKKTESSDIKFKDALDDFCACKDLAEVEKEKCHDEWVENFKGIQGSRAEGEELGKAMAKCDPEGTMKILPKLQ